MSNYQTLEVQINKKAMELTRVYMQSLPQLSDSEENSIQQKAYLVYKFCNTPREVLESGMMKMQPN